MTSRATFASLDLAGHRLGRVERPELFHVLIRNGLERMRLDAAGVIWPAKPRAKPDDDPDQPARTSPSAICIVHRWSNSSCSSHVGNVEKFTNTEFDG